MKSELIFDREVGCWSARRKTRWLGKGHHLKGCGSCPGCSHLDLGQPDHKPVRGVEMHIDKANDKVQPGNELVELACRA